MDEANPLQCIGAHTERGKSAVPLIHYDGLVDAGSFDASRLTSPTSSRCFELRDELMGFIDRSRWRT